MHGKHPSAGNEKYQKQTPKKRTSVHVAVWCRKTPGIPSDVVKKIASKIPHNHGNLALVVASAPRPKEVNRV